MTEYTTGEGLESLTVAIAVNGSVTSSFNVTVQAVDGTAIGELCMIV